MLLQKEIRNDDALQIKDGTSQSRVMKSLREETNNNLDRNDVILGIGTSAGTIKAAKRLEQNSSCPQTTAMHCDCDSSSHLPLLKKTLS